VVLWLPDVYEQVAGFGATHCLVFVAAVSNTKNHAAGNTAWSEYCGHNM
jgi:hypothetical protein